MIRYYNIDGTLDVELLSGFIEFLNKIENEDKIVVYLSSCGGDVDVSTQLIDIFNNNDSIIKVKFLWQISSCAFNIMLNTKIEKLQINESVWSCLHLLRRDVSTIDLLNKDDRVDFLLKNLEHSNKNLIETFKNIGLKKEYIKEIEQGKDVYLNYDEIIKLIYR